MAYVKDSENVAGAKDAYHITMLMVDPLAKRCQVQVRKTTIGPDGVPSTATFERVIADNEAGAFFSDLAARVTEGGSLYDEIKAGAYEALAALGAVPPETDGWAVT